MSDQLKMYLSELKDHHEYKEMASKEPQKAQYYNQMAEDEKKHAGYILELYPEIHEEMEELKELLSFM